MVQATAEIPKDLSARITFAKGSDVLTAVTPYGECAITAGSERSHAQFRLLVPAVIDQLAYQIVGRLNLTCPRDVGVELTQCDAGLDKNGQITGVWRPMHLNREAYHFSYGLGQALAEAITDRPSLVQALESFWDTAAEQEKVRTAIATAQEYIDLARTYADSLGQEGPRAALPPKVDLWLRFMESLSMLKGTSAKHAS